MDLAVVHELCIEEIRSNIAFLSAGFLMRDSGRQIEELSRLFQGLAICHLLESLDAGQFRENLVRSGYARRYFLDTSQQQNSLASKYFALSRSEVLLDVLVAGDLPLARSIVQLSATQWNRDWEYEDDFCFYFFLHQLLLEAPSTTLGQTVLRFERALQGQADPRLGVLQALLAHDGAAFESALTTLLQEEETRADTKRAAMTMESQFLFWPRSFVSIEGLALIRAADLMGIPVEGEFPICPREARLPLAEVKYRDFFAELGSLLAQ